MYKYIRSKAFEYPFAAWGIIFGFSGPIAVLATPPISKKLGHVRPEPVPRSYPLPNRPRRPTFGYED
ncbi:NADH-ubiquinone oxidoreductase [Smittium culicis]|uniref:NADH-ubiquinone oxidoreductase n=1 Tax=Smittium culicis TaxID=133412 RepID=A0A1R1X7F8_9FUNG|nr:NADH-ubiquinone oxidoreductase [Smittium culicis]